jgi:hypothetical protein
MSKFNTGNTVALQIAVNKYLSDLAGDIVFARKLWYEGLGGEGTASDDDVAAIEAAIAANSQWKPAGDLRDEKFGVQNSFKREGQLPYTNMIQHAYKLNGLYRTPEGKTLKIVCSEVFNLRCFEIVDGNMTGPMIKIHPDSDLARALTEVA